MLFFSVVLSTCYMTTVEKSNKQPGKKLLFLSNYESGKEINGNEVVTKYQKLGVIQSAEGKKFSISIDDDTVFKGDWNAHSYQLEVFDERYLLISCVQGISNASGPDNYQRDSVYIVGLRDKKSDFISMPNVFLTRSKEYLLKNYNCPQDTQKYLRDFSRCVIDSLDLKGHNLYLFNPCRQTEVLRTRPVIW
jgi:hypothetical protein